MDSDTYEEETDDMALDNERDSKRRLDFEENDGVVDDDKALIHAKRWYLYIFNKLSLIKGGYYVEVLGCDRGKVLWEVVDDCFVRYLKEKNDIRLQRFDFN